MGTFLVSMLTGGLSFLKSIPAKAWIVMGVVIVVLILLFKIDSAWNKHVKYVDSLAAQNRALLDQNTRMNSRIADLTVINAANKATYDQELQAATQARAVAEQERQAAQARATHYRSIRDAALSQPRHAVSPAVQSTVDRLWDNSTAGSTRN